jgi:hypothetical protein
MVSRDDRPTLYDIAIGDYVKEEGKPLRKMTPRERRMIGYSTELKALITRSIEANPAMEESFLLIAELAFRDAEERAL